MTIITFTIAVAAGSQRRDSLVHRPDSAAESSSCRCSCCCSASIFAMRSAHPCVSVIATSSGAAAAYVREGYSNIRVGMFLEIATTLGALSGAIVATRVPTSGLAIVFGCVLLYSAYLSAAGRITPPRCTARSVGDASRLDSTYPTATGEQGYRVSGVPAGFGLMYVAGVLSGSAGYWLRGRESAGDGSRDAPAIQGIDDHEQLHDRRDRRGERRRVPSHRGYIDPGLAMPVVLGVLLGSMQGARVLASAPARRLRIVFMWVIVALAAEMLFNGVTGRI